MVLRIFWDIRRETSLFHWKQVSNHQVPDMIWWKSHLVKQTQLNWYKIMLFLHCSRWFKLGVVSHRENDSTLLSEQSLWGVKPHKQGLYIMNIHWDIDEGEACKEKWHNTWKVQLKHTNVSMWTHQLHCQNLWCA